MNRYVFGPVASRRLGRSLGIDLIPYKTCSYNCVYCECGATTDLTITRQDFYPLKEVLAELDRVLAKKPDLDYITFAGSGEPTLSKLLGPVIKYLKEHYPWYRVAVLTNGTLCMLPEVRNDLLLADLIIPTVPASDQAIQDRIFRPYRNISVSSILSGLISLRKEFTGQIWAEVFLVPGINTGRDELLGIRESIMAIRPDLIQLNSLDRPGTESWVHPVQRLELIQIRDFFAETGIPTDIAGFGQRGGSLPHIHDHLVIS